MYLSVFQQNLGLTCPYAFARTLASSSLARVALLLPSWSSKVLLVLEDPDEMLRKASSMTAEFCASKSALKLGEVLSTVEQITQNSGSNTSWSIAQNQPIEFMREPCQVWR